MKLFEYVDSRGQGVFTEWYRRLPKPQRAALDAKMDVVRKAGEPGDANRGELPPSLFRGPVKKGNKSYPHTYKLTVNGPVALRPLACKGPQNEEEGWTILVPVIESGNKYPPGCFELAEERRAEILLDPSRRREIPTEDSTDTEAPQGVIE